MALAMKKQHTQFIKTASLIVVAIAFLPLPLQAATKTCEPVYYSAIDDFTESTQASDGQALSYPDTERKALAIDAAKWGAVEASATRIFDGASGTYDIGLITMTEIDGESTYQLFIDGQLVGRYQNPETEHEFAVTSTQFNAIDVPHGATLEMRFNSHTNGKIPENGGTAFARGRWRSLSFECAGSDQPPVSVQGDAMRWHPITLTFAGPDSSETASPNPFMDYRLDVTFTHKNGSAHVVPGYYAACGNAAETSCVDGNKWRVNFTPALTGEWAWQASFVEGAEVAINQGGKPSSYIHGLQGKIDIVESDKTGIDFRAKHKGRLQYVGEHYLRHMGTGNTRATGDWFLKAGADATENTLAYDGFDATPNRKNLRKSWAAHGIDFDENDAADYRWQGNAGDNLLGMVRYLSEQGMNAVSFLTFNLGGDDQNVFPHLLSMPASEYEALPHTLTIDGDPLDADLLAQNAAIRNNHWVSGVHQDRFDVSKLAQWEKVFAYADKRGMYLHVKLAEEENETLMDFGDIGRERKLYYRELIARFGHHLALNWNIGEENGPPVAPYMSHEQRISAAQYIADLDPYNHHIVVHTRPNAPMQDKVYTPMLGDNAFTGVSLQCFDNTVVHQDVLRWVQQSAKAGKKWVVANDEQGNYWNGVTVDADYSGELPSENNEPDNRVEVRSQVVWATLLAGGAGVEFYYGYKTGCGDLNCQDHRTRATKWQDAKHAITFFNEHMLQYLPNVENANALTAAEDDYVLANHGKAYVVYLPSGGSTYVDLPKGRWKVRWYNPRSGGELSRASRVKKNAIHAPGNQEDWVALIQKK